jgi:hypothetical protein
MTTTDHRQAAAATLERLIAVLKSHGDAAEPILGECESLARAVDAFHMEGIRFRMFNVDRLLARGGSAGAPEAAALLEEVRKHLEAAGFHTRSHQAPT